jgi:hypothetical protein
MRLVLKEALVGITYFSNLMRIDRDGAVVCSALPYAKDLNLSAAPVFGRARQSAGFVVSGEIASAVLQRPVVAGMLPLRDAQGNFQGVLSIELDTAWLDSLMRTHTRAPGAVVFIADRDRHVLGSNDRTVAQALIQGASWTENSSILREARDAAGNNWRFSEITLQGGQLFIGYAMKESALFSATYLSVATDFLTPVLMIMLAWTAIWFATEQQVTRWILYLRRISAAYRGGHYAIRPSLTGAPSEFTALGPRLLGYGQFHSGPRPAVARRGRTEVGPDPGNPPSRKEQSASGDELVEPAGGARSRPRRPAGADAGPGADQRAGRGASHIA